MAKNDQQRLGSSTVIGRVNGPTCPVNAMWQYFQYAKPPPDGPLFVTKTGALHYSTALKILRVLIGHGWSLYGLHSFRVGGAQALALAGRSVVYIMARGRWKSSDSVSRYVAAPDDVLCDNDLR